MVPFEHCTQLGETTPAMSFCSLNFNHACKSGSDSWLSRWPGLQVRFNCSVTTFAPYWGTELFAVVNLTLDGDSEGIQSRMYTKKAGAYALKVAFETAVKDAAGYK
jgi:hypothetical protein